MGIEKWEITTKFFDDSDFSFRSYFRCKPFYNDLL